MNGLTWISVSKSGGLLEIAVPRIPASSLIEEIHCIGSMCCHSIWVKTCSTSLNWTTINTLATGIVKIWLQLSIRNTRFGHTPTSCRLWYWCNWGYGSCGTHRGRSCRSCRSLGGRLATMLLVSRCSPDRNISYKFQHNFDEVQGIPWLQISIYLLERFMKIKPISLKRCCYIQARPHQRLPNLCWCMKTTSNARA